MLKINKYRRQGIKNDRSYEFKANALGSSQ